MRFPLSVQQLLRTKFDGSHLVWDKWFWERPLRILSGRSFGHSLLLCSFCSVCFSNVYDSGVFTLKILKAVVKPS